MINDPNVFLGANAAGSPQLRAIHEALHEAERQFDLLRTFAGAYGKNLRPSDQAALANSVIALGRHAREINHRFNQKAQAAHE